MHPSSSLLTKAQLDNLNIPLVIESVEALEFMGFTRCTSKRVFRRYDTRPKNSMHDEFLVYAHGQANYLYKMTEEQVLRDDVALRITGVKKSLIEAILDPEFGDVYGTQDLRFWLKDTLRINYLTLVNLQRRVARCTPSQRQDGTVPDALPEEYFTALGSAPPLDDHITLYKATTSAEAMEERPFRPHNGTLDIRPFKPSRGEVAGDFTGPNYALHLYTDRRTAERFRRYTARRCPAAETWMSSVQIPNSLWSTFRVEELQYGPEWRELVWHNRHFGELPRRLKRFKGTGLGVQVIQGPICSSDKEVLKIKGRDIHKLMTEDMIMKCGREYALQTVIPFERL